MPAHKHDNSLLTAERLKEILHYDPDTGIFTWRIRRYGSPPIGTEAGTPKKDGYIYIRINNRGYPASRLAWFYMTGRWPEPQVDHINRIKSDNRFLNLRESTSLRNSANVGISSRNTSGYRGVSFYKKSGKWTAYVRQNYKLIYLGRYDTVEEAAEVAAEARGERL